MCNESDLRFIDGTPEHDYAVEQAAHSNGAPCSGSLSVNYFAKGAKLLVRYWSVKEQIWSYASEVDLVEAAQRLQLLENQFIADRTENERDESGRRAEEVEQYARDLYELLLQATDWAEDGFSFPEKRKGELVLRGRALGVTGPKLGACKVNRPEEVKENEHG